MVIGNVVNAPSYKPISDFGISLKTNDGYKSLADVSAAWTNTAMSTFDTVVSSTDGFKGESAVFTFALTGLSAKQKYVNIKFNSLFG